MNKWTTASPADSAQGVAIQSLRTRFQAVRRYLRRAATGHGDAEDVHQLRVWARRFESALTVFADLLPRRQAKWLRKTIRRIHRAAGRVRDLDVLSRKLRRPDGTWPARLGKKRARAASKLTELRIRLGTRLKRRMNKLLDRLASHSPEHRRLFGAFAQTILQPIVASFFDSSPVQESDPSTLHKFRIVSKELRYAMEILAGAFPNAFRDDLYPTLAVVQDKLGEINDLATLRDKLQKKLDRTPNPAKLSDLRRRLATVGEDLERTRAEFAYWWSADTRRDLRTRFDEFIGDPRAT
jgi:CHAD domain-containing protein